MRMTIGATSIAGGKRARTRAALIEAAARLVAKKGFDATTLDNVAAEAGMTRGAIYGNFKNREDLFLAVAQTYWSPLAPPLTPGASFRRQMREPLRLIQMNRIRQLCARFQI